MSIIRGPRPETRFYTLDKSISEDPRLSWAARGLLIFLLGKPDHWEVSVKHLINQTKDAIGKHSSRDAVRVILKELEEAGYMMVDVARSNGGSFNGMAYTVREIPSRMDPSADGCYPQASPAPANPAPANPAPANPAPANPHLVKNDLQQLPDLEAKTDYEIAGRLAGAASLPSVSVAPRIEIPEDMPGPKDQSCKTFKTWANYAFAYRRRYSVWPKWNAKSAGQVSQLVDRLGADEAHHVAAFYVGVNDARLINECHSLNVLLAKAEAIHTQWATGRQMNATTARQLEQTQANLNAAEEAARRILERGERNEFL